MAAFSRRGLRSAGDDTDSRSDTEVSPLSTAREPSVSFSVLKASASTASAPVAISWRSTPRSATSLNSAPMPKVLMRSCPNCLTFSVALPRRMSMMWPAPKLMPLSCCTR
ncbi:hypothetical protein D3C72_1227720 [compost metagenome]